MTIRRLRICILLVAAIVTHDGYMAAFGHEMALTVQGSTCAPVEITVHHRHDHGNQPNPDQPILAPEISEGCDPLGEAASFNRVVNLTLDDLPATLLPGATVTILFAATSRSMVELPPPRAPDSIRALFQVYRL